MGPWSVRLSKSPFGPGCSYARLCVLIERGRITPDTILRGPSTHQFWTPARKVPGVAHRLGVCHSCGGPAEASAFSCGRCGARFAASEDRQHLGLAPSRMLPGSATPARVAATNAPAEPASVPVNAWAGADLSAQHGDHTDPPRVSAPRVAGGPRWLSIGLGSVVVAMTAGVLGWWLADRAARVDAGVRGDDAPVSGAVAPSQGPEEAATPPTRVQRPQGVSPETESIVRVPSERTEPVTEPAEAAAALSPGEREVADRVEAIERLRALP